MLIVDARNILGIFALSLTITCLVSHHCSDLCRVRGCRAQTLSRQISATSNMSQWCRLRCPFVAKITRCTVVLCVVPYVWGLWWTWRKTAHRNLQNILSLKETHISWLPSAPSLFKTNLSPKFVVYVILNTNFRVSDIVLSFLQRNSHIHISKIFSHLCVFLGSWSLPRIRFVLWKLWGPMIRIFRPDESWGSGRKLCLFASPLPFRFFPPFPWHSLSPFPPKSFPPSFAFPLLFAKTLPFPSFPPFTFLSLFPLPLLSPPFHLSALPHCSHHVALKRAASTKHAGLRPVDKRSRKGQPTSAHI